MDEVAQLTAAPLGRLDREGRVPQAKDVEDPIVMASGRAGTGQRPPVELFVEVGGEQRSVVEITGGEGDDGVAAWSGTLRYDDMVAEGPAGE